MSHKTTLIALMIVLTGLSASPSPAAAQYFLPWNWNKNKKPQTEEKTEKQKRGLIIIAPEKKKTPAASAVSGEWNPQTQAAATGPGAAPVYNPEAAAKWARQNQERQQKIAALSQKESGQIVLPACTPKEKKALGAIKANQEEYIRQANQGNFSQAEKISDNLHRFFQDKGNMRKVSVLTMKCGAPDQEE